MTIFRYWDNSNAFFSGNFVYQEQGGFIIFLSVKLFVGCGSIRKVDNVAEIKKFGESCVFDTKGKNK